jgi:hypothetical protein
MAIDRIRGLSAGARACFVEFTSGSTQKALTMMAWMMSMILLMLD